jgi:hypothetical protein
MKLESATSLKKELLAKDLWSGIGQPAASVAFAAGRAAAKTPSPKPGHRSPWQARKVPIGRPNSRDGTRDG